MIKFEKKDFDESFDDILDSINGILNSNNTDDGYKIEESEESEMLKRKNQKLKEEEERKNKV